MILNLIAAAQNTLNALELFWKGMLAIVIVIVLIFIVTFCMTYFTPDAKAKRLKAKEEKENRKNDENRN